MPWAAAAVVAGAGISAAASKSAAKSQAKSADAASAAQERMFEQNRQDQEPWRRAGQQGLDALLSGLGLSNPNGTLTTNSLADARLVDTMSGTPMMNSKLYATDPIYKAAWDQAVNEHQIDHGVGYGEGSDVNVINNRLREIISANPELANRKAETSTPQGYGDLARDFRMSDYLEDPGYKFRLEQGENAINRNALANGRYNSGATLKALQGYNSDMASQEFSNAFNRFRTQQSDRFNRFASVAGIGQTATNQVGADRSAFGNAMASNTLAAGNAMAAGRIGTANAINGAVGQGLNYYQNQQYLNSLRSQPAMGSTWNPAGFQMGQGGGSSGWVSGSDLPGG